MTTGQRIRAVRKEAKMTQEDLGQKLGISGSSIAQWENDLRNPKYETLQRIATVLRIPVDQILGNPSWVNENLRFFRKIDGLSREKLSEETGIAVSDIRAYEDPSSTRYITSEHLQKMAAYFQVPCERILGNSVTYECMVETIQKNTTQPKQITFNATPDPEWADLEEKAENGTLTPEEAQRFKELMDQASASLHRTVTIVAERLNHLLDRLNEAGQQKVMDYAQDLTRIHEYHSPRSTLDSAEGSNTAPVQDAPEAPTEGE